MNLHPFMVEAIYLRMHPEDKIEKDTGIIIWYCATTNKYLWKYKETSPKHKNRPNIYEAKGLQSWWYRYLKQIELESSEEDEEDFWNE